MALIDVVKCEASSDEFVKKFPSSQIKLGSQLVVMPGQRAYFVKGGKRLDEFEPGTYTLHTNNIPLLSTLINLPYGGSSPFDAEVWFVNLLTKLDNKWGTPEPIMLEDPKYKIIVHVRAFGQFGLRIIDPGSFLDTLVGSLNTFTADMVMNYFKGKIQSTIVTLISQKMIKDNISVLEILTQLEELSFYCGVKLNETFVRYGIELVDFCFISINTPDNEPGLKALEAAQEKAMYINTVGKDLYTYDANMKVLDSAAHNSGGLGGAVGAGIGLTVGANIGNKIGTIANQTDTSLGQNQSVPPPPPVQYHVLINNEQQGPIDLSAVGDLILRHSVLRETYIWKPGLSEWAKASTLPEFQSYFAQLPPPPPTH